jgi:hypothetical protein|tara:strand:- start:50 stop:313 length:264 start_codon:yes stop_codon:yes gene_type:complete
MRRLYCFIILAAILVAPMAVAQEDTSESKVRYKKKTEIDFEDVAIHGALKVPHGQYLLEKRGSAFNPLIRLKENFNKEMIDSVTQVR